jgi:hypothetical protein
MNQLVNFISYWTLLLFQILQTPVQGHDSSQMLLSMVVRIMAIEHDVDDLAEEIQELKRTAQNRHNLKWSAKSPIQTGI